MQSMLWAGAAGCAGIAGMAVLGDRRRHRRTNPDRVGWIPWPAVLILAIMGAAICAALAIRAN